MTRNEHIGSSIFVLIGSGAGLIFSLIKHAQPKMITNLALDPYTLPAVVFACMFVFGICRLVVGLRMEKTGEKGTLLKIPKKTLITAALIAAYALALKPVGFVISSFVYLWLQMLVLQEEKKHWKLMTIVAVICSLGIYLMFTKVFSVMLPRGILTML